MFVLQAKELRAADQWTLKLEGISSLQLMERAATRLLAALLQDYPVHKHAFTVLCGPGNNGGDGLVLARLLRVQGADCSVYLLECDRYSEENRENQKLVENILPLRPSTVLNLSRTTVVIDALYGSGLQRPLAAEWAALIEQLARNTVLSVDVPSGMITDARTDGPVFPSTKVYTLHAPKLAFFAAENDVQSFQTIDIGLRVPHPSPFAYTDEAAARLLLKSPSRFSHKGTFGHAYLIGGSQSMSGALCLAAKSALRGGCGLVSVYGPKLTLALPPEIMVHTDPHTEHLTHIPALPDKVTAVGLGMGLGKHTGTFMKDFLAQPPSQALVLDADALNHIAALKLSVPPGSILTPHVKEFERLCGPSKNSFERWEKAQAFAEKTNSVLVLKGANTCVFTSSGERYYNASGNYGMAKGGAGDVLTGLITALRAQGYGPTEAAVLGVFLHGRAGDLAADKLGRDALCASDLIDHLSGAWKSLRSACTTA